MRISPTEQELIDKHEFGTVISAAMQAMAQNPAMLRVFGMDPEKAGQFVVDMALSMRESMKKGLRPKSKTLSKETVASKRAELQDYINKVPTKKQAAIDLAKKNYPNNPEIWQELE